MKSRNIRLVFVCALAFALVWLLSWLGYSSSKPTAQQEILNKNNLEFRLNRLKLADRLNEAVRKTDLLAKGKHLQGHEPDDHIHVVNSSQSEKNVGIQNLVQKLDSKQHLENMHKGHAQKLNFINSNLQNKHFEKIKNDEKLPVKEPKRNNMDASDQKPESGLKNIQIDDTYYALIHSGTASRVHHTIHTDLKSMPESIPPENYILQSESLPKDPKFNPSIGNGNIGTVVHSEKVFVNGVYNGFLTDSHRAVIPSTCAVSVTATDPPTEYKRLYKLNMAQGMYIEESTSEKYTLTQRLYAHRTMTNLIVLEVDLVRKTAIPLNLQVKLNKWTASDDITFLKTESELDEVSYKHGKINSPETEKSDYTEVHIYYDHVPDVLTPPAGSLKVKWIFLTSIGITREEAKNAYLEGIKLLRDQDKLYSSHVQAWADLWARGAIHIRGNPQLARITYACYYYILSSIPLKQDLSLPYVGLSPSGIAHGDFERDYLGHIFWDQETWMYPPVLFFHADLAELLLSTRKRTMEEAKKKAQSNRFGGLQYPWESAATGVEVSPCPYCAKHQLHINGDISLAIMQYLYATNKVSVLHSENGGGYTDILAGIAEFWVSQLKYDQTKNLYEIKHVMPPDEDARNVNNSVYTNTIAKMSLTAVSEVFDRLGKSNSRFNSYVEKIYIPFDDKLQYHPEHDSYKGQSIKQADVILLGYPLNQKMPQIVRKNDLEYYEKVVRKTGPAMTWSMFSIGWLELGEHEKANQHFKKNFGYINGDFQVWSEVLGQNGSVNFLTGMGGFLQNIIAGYAGFRLNPYHLCFNPVLPPDTTEVQFVDIDYLGSSFDFLFNEEEILVTLKRQEPNAPMLRVYVYKSQQPYKLDFKKTIKIPRAKGAVLSTDVELPADTMQNG